MMTRFDRYSIAFLFVALASISMLWAHDMHARSVAASQEAHAISLRLDRALKARGF